MRLFFSAIFLTLALATASGCKSAAGPQAGGGFTMPPTPVETAQVTRGTVSDRLHAVGTLEANESVEVVSELEGVIRALPLREGETVARGQVLVQIDDAELKAQLTRAEALLEQSRTTYERTRRVVDEKIRPPQDLDDATAARKVAEANLELARVRLEKTVVRAPFSGLLGARLVSPGAWVRAGDPIARLADITELKVAFAAPERYLVALRPGSSVRISAPSFSGWEAEGTIDLVDPAVDPGTRNVRMRARVTNPEGRLKPGMSVDVSVVLAERKDALSIPSEAVFAEGDRFYAFVLKPDGTVTRAALTLGARTASEVEIASGLEAGQQVVRAGHQKLYEGAKVMPAGAPAGDKK